MEPGSDFTKLLTYIRENPREDVPEIVKEGQRAELKVFGFTTYGAVFFEEEEYISFQEALDEMKSIQPVGFDPSKPSEGLNSHFFEGVKSFLQINNENLKLFISVGTKLDYFHGADAVFSWEGSNVTIDVTVDDTKIRRYHQRQSLREKGDKSRKEVSKLLDLEKKIKADIVISPRNVETEELLAQVSREIALLLMARHLDSLDRDMKTNRTQCFPSRT